MSHAHKVNSFWLKVSSTKKLMKKAKNKLPESPRKSLNLDKLKNKKPNRIGMRIKISKIFVEWLPTIIIKMDEDKKISTDPEASIPSIPSMKLIALENQIIKKYIKKRVNIFNKVASEKNKELIKSQNVNKSKIARIFWINSFVKTPLSFKSSKKPYKEEKNIPA